MDPYINLLGKNYTKKEFFLKVKKYVEKHTALVTAVFSGLLTAIILFFNLIFTAYKIGELGFFGIDIAYAFDYDRNGIVLRLLLYVSVAGIFCFINFLGYMAYIKSYFIKYLLMLTLIIIFSLFFIIMILSGISVFEFFWQVIYEILPTSIILSVALALPSITYTLFPSYKDKIARLVLKKNKLSASGKITEKKENKINNKIKKLTPTSNKNKSNTINSNSENSSSHSLKMNLLIKPVLFMFFIGITAAVFLWNGFLQSGSKTSFNTVSSNSLSKIQELELSNYSFDEYAVLFENSEYIILSPYVIETDEDNNEQTVIYTCYQIKTSNENVPSIKKSFKNVFIESDYNDLAKYKN